MLNVKAESEDEPRYAGISEAARAIAALGPSDLRRLELIARSRAQGLPGIEWQDLLQECLARTLGGSRRWPKHVSLITFLAQTMRSIASDLRQRASEDYPGDDDKLDVADNPHFKTEAAQQLRDILRYFAEDTQVRELISGLQVGETAMETQKRCGLSPIQYDAARKRFWRGVALVSGDNL